MNGNWPKLKLGTQLLPGLAAGALFLVMAVVFVQAPFGEAQGFPQDASVVAGLGYAMFNLDLGAIPSESFLVAFEIIDIVLVAALAGAVMLARREEAGADQMEAMADGGRRLKRALTDGGRNPFRDDDGGEE